MSAMLIAGRNRQSTTPSIPAKPFAPPDGYRPVQKHSAESTDFSKSFSDLTGKQIWHITAPVGVPVKSIQELSLDAVATGQPVLSHKGLEYCLREDQLGAEKTKVLLLPDKHGKTYHRNKLPVAQTFHVEQVVDAPNNATLSSADTESTIQRLSKPLPPKPKHLRMRYKPFGSADDAAGARGSSPEDSEKEEVNFREPEGSRIDRDAKKRKHTDNNEDSKSKAGASVEPGAKGDSPRKKAKKGHAKFNDDTAKTDKEPSQPSVPTPDHESEVRGREKTQSHSTEHKKSKKRTDETSQERRARKEEKKRKIREEENIATG